MALSRPIAFGATATIGGCGKLCGSSRFPSTLAPMAHACRSLRQRG